MSTPEGELVTRTLAMPANTNAAGDIFGGWLLSQMDIGGALLAKSLAENRVATIAIDAMKFHHPVWVGDVVSCYASVTKKGNTSVTVKVQVWTTSIKMKDTMVTEGLFTYVSLDRHGRPTPINWS